MHKIDKLFCLAKDRLNLIIKHQRVGKLALELKGLFYGMIYL